MQLTKQSCEAEIKVYFREVLKLAQGNEEFPVNLDDVWPLVYARKDKAVRALKDNELFMQNIDYILLPKMGSKMTRNRSTEMRSGQMYRLPKMASKKIKIRAEVIIRKLTSSPSPALSSSSPARYVPCSRSTARCSTRLSRQHSWQRKTRSPTSPSLSDLPKPYSRCRTTCTRWTCAGRV